MAQNLVDMQLERLREAPPIVVWLLQNLGAWVGGSRAAFRDVRIHEKSDWDILIPLHLWHDAVGALPLEKVKPTKAGGYRFEAEFLDGRPPVVVDVFTGDVGLFLQKPYIHVLWHPKTATIIEKVHSLER
jgi:hypothetical protein